MVIAGVLAFDEAETLAILMQTVTLRLGMSILPAVRANPEDGAVAEIVGTCLTPGAVGVNEVWCGIDMTEVGAEFAIGNEEGYIVVMT